MYICVTNWFVIDRFSCWNEERLSADSEYPGIVKEPCFSGVEREYKVQLPKYNGGCPRGGGYGGALQAPKAPRCQRILRYAKAATMQFILF